MLDLSSLTEYLHGCAPQQVVERLRYGSYVSSSRRYVFMETPKAACTTLKWIVEHIEGVSRKPGITMQSSLKMAVHARGGSGIPSLADIGTDSLIDICRPGSNWLRFCVVRNPYARLVSAWADKVRQREPGYAWTWKQIALSNGNSLDPPPPPDFAGFLDWVIRRQRPRACNQHWRPMTYLLLPNLLNYTHVLKTEQLSEGLAEVLQRIGIKESATELLSHFASNESLPVDWRSLYDEATATKVYRYYKVDFDSFGYDPQSWRNGSGRQGEDSVELLASRLTTLQGSALGAIRERNDMIVYLSEALVKLRQNQRNLK